MRVIHDNAVDRATLTASSSVGDLVPANLQTDIKGDTWRAAGGAATLTMTLPAGEVIGGVVLAFANFTSTATMRVRGYDYADELVVDTGVQLACGYAALGAWEWGAIPLGANAYAYGGHVYGIAWFAPASLTRLEIDIEDIDNPAGCIEVGRLIAGMYWEPKHNASYGPELTFEDASQHVQNDAGDTLTRIGPARRRLTLSLDHLPPADRNRLADLFRQGLARPAFLSLTPGDDDQTKEQQYAIYGKRPGDASLVYEFYASWRAQLTIREV